MLLLFIACLGLVLLWRTISAVRRHRRVDVVDLGWMSQQWLVQHRASHAAF
jgi:hypothetical protein